MKRLPKLKFERVEGTSLFKEIAAVVLAMTGALLVTGFLFRVAGADPLVGLISLIKGGFGGKQQIIATLLRATPLLLTGLATVIAFRGQLWSIGQEGQLFAGAMLSYWVLLQCGNLPRVPLLIVIILSGIVGGALLGLISGIMKAYFKVDIIISTVLLNYIVNEVILMLLYDHKFWMDAASFYPRTPAIPAKAMYPTVMSGGIPIHLGVGMAIAAALLIYWILKNTPLGYDIRVLGANLTAARFRGININRVLIVTMLISGALAGLAGTGEVFGVQYRLSMGISIGYGYTGIIVAMLAELNPLLTILTALFFGGLLNGSVSLVTSIGIPTEVIYVVQAIILIFILAARVLIHYRIRRVTDVG